MTRALRAVPGTPPRAVIYVRQSVHREESISLELQETACRDYAAARGYVVLDVVADAGVSGLQWAKRPGVQSVLRRVEAREVDVVLVWRWSRLSRRRLHQAMALDAVERAGARVEAATEPIDTTTAGGEFGRDVLLAAAHFESRQKAEQWRETHERRLRLGLPPTGGDRFGYVRDPDGTGDRDAYAPDPVTGPVLASMYARFVAGQGFTSIAADLNAAGHTTRTGGPWTRDRVTRVLDSGWGAGKVVLGRGEAARYVDGRHQGVVDEVTWQAYLRARGRRRGVPPRRVEPSYPLTGLIRCGDCGSPMHADRLGVRAGYAYVCSRWKASRACRCVSVTRAKAEAAVLAQLEEWAGDVDAAAAAQAERAAAAVVARAGTADVARQLQRVEDRLAKLTLGWSDGLVPDGAYATARDELVAARAQLAASLEEAAAVQERAGVDVAASARHLVEEWDELPVRGKRDLLAVLVAEVRVVRPAGSGRGGRSGVEVVVVPVA